MALFSVAPWWIAQTGGPVIDPATQYTSLGVAGLICGVLTWWLLTTRSENSGLRTEVRDLNRQRLEDRDKLLPLVADMVRALGGATVALETKERRSLDQTLAGIEAQLSDLRKKGQP